MEIDVNLHKPTASNGLELKTISAGVGYNHTNGPGTVSGIPVDHSNLHNHLHNNNNNNNNSNSHNHQQQEERRIQNAEDDEEVDNRLRCLAAATTQTSASPLTGCCGILTRLLCSSSHTRGKTATSSGDYNNYSHSGPIVHSTLTNGNAVGFAGIATSNSQSNPLHMNLWKKNQKTHRRTPQEIYFESRGKSCKKLLKFNGNSNKILLYPEEGWARTASSSYWTITPCWWQPNRCRIEEFAGTQRQVTKAKMVPLEQKGSLLIVGQFRSKNSSSSSSATLASSTTAASANATTAYLSSAAATASTIKTSSNTTLCSPLSSSNSSSAKDNDEFKLYLSSNISMEDYNMGYCLTGFVERRCQQTNTFQMTHFAVIKRQWPSLAQNNKNTKSQSSSWTSCSGNASASKST